MFVPDVYSKYNFDRKRFTEYSFNKLTCMLEREVEGSRLVRDIVSITVSSTFSSMRFSVGFGQDHLVILIARRRPGNWRTLCSIVRKCTIRGNVAIAVRLFASHCG